MATDDELEEFDRRDNPRACDRPDVPPPLPALPPGDDGKCDDPAPPTPPQFFPLPGPPEPPARDRRLPPALVVRSAAVTLQCPDGATTLQSGDVEDAELEDLVFVGDALQAADDELYRIQESEGVPQLQVALDGMWAALVDDQIDRVTLSTTIKSLLQVDDPPALRLADEILERLASLMVSAELIALQRRRCEYASAALWVVCDPDAGYVTVFDEPTDGTFLHAPAGTATSPTSVAEANVVAATDVARGLTCLYPSDEVTVTCAAIDPAFADALPEQVGWAPETFLSDFDGQTFVTVSDARQGAAGRQLVYQVTLAAGHRQAASPANATALAEAEARALLRCFWPSPELVRHCADGEAAALPDAAARLAAASWASTWAATFATNHPAAYAAWQAAEISDAGIFTLVEMAASQTGLNIWSDTGVAVNPDVTDIAEFEYAPVVGIVDGALVAEEGTAFVLPAGGFVSSASATSAALQAEAYARQFLNCGWSHDAVNCPCPAPDGGSTAVLTQDRLGGLTARQFMFDDLAGQAAVESMPRLELGDLCGASSPCVYCNAQQIPICVDTYDVNYPFTPRDPVYDADANPPITPTLPVSRPDSTSVLFSTTLTSGIRANVYCSESIELVESVSKQLALVPPPMVTEPAECLYGNGRIVLNCAQKSAAERLTALRDGDTTDAIAGLLAPPLPDPLPDPPPIAPLTPTASDAALVDPRFASAEIVVAPNTFQELTIESANKKAMALALSLLNCVYTRVIGGHGGSESPVQCGAPQEPPAETPAIDIIVGDSAAVGDGKVDGTLTYNHLRISPPVSVVTPAPLVYSASSPVVLGELAYRGLINELDCFIIAAARHYCVPRPDNRKYRINGQLNLGSRHTGASNTAPGKEDPADPTNPGDPDDPNRLPDGLWSSDPGVIDGLLPPKNLVEWENTGIPARFMHAGVYPNTQVNNGRVAAEGSTIIIPEVIGTDVPVALGFGKSYVSLVEARASAYAQAKQSVDCTHTNWAIANESMCRNGLISVGVGKVVAEGTYVAGSTTEANIMAETEAMIDAQCQDCSTPLGLFAKQKTDSGASAQVGICGGGAITLGRGGGGGLICAPENETLITDIRLEECAGVQVGPGSASGFHNFGPLTGTHTFWLQGACCDSKVVFLLRKFEQEVTDENIKTKHTELANDEGIKRPVFYIGSVQVGASEDVDGGPVREVKVRQATAGSFQTPGDGGDGIEGAFYTRYIDSGVTYLQGGSVTGGTGNVGIAPVELVDINGDPTGSPGDHLILTVTGNGYEVDGVVLPAFDILSATVTILPFMPTPNTIPTSGSVNGKTVFVSLGVFTASGFQPAGVGNVAVSYCPGSYKVTRTV